MASSVKIKLGVKTASVKANFATKVVSAKMNAAYATGATQSRRGYTAVSQETQVADILLMKAHKANVVRWMLYRTFTVDNRQDLAAYQTWLNGQLLILDGAMAACAANGMKIIIDLHTPPGEFYTDGSQRCMYDSTFAAKYVQVWQQIANRYKNFTGLHAYELMNEPVQAHAGTLLYNHIEIQSMAARAIRAIDPSTTLIFASDAWNAPTPFFLQPITEFQNIEYSVHHYQIIEYTHQGIPGFVTVQYTYPGTFPGWGTFGKAQMKQTLQTVRDFQLANNVKIFVGEFSAARWAAGASQWLQDAIDIFEEYGWDWVYHAWSNYATNPYSSTIFSLEAANKTFGDQTTTITTTPTDRKTVVLSGFKKNKDGII